MQLAVPSSLGVPLLPGPVPRPSLCFRLASCFFLAAPMTLAEVAALLSAASSTQCSLLSLDQVHTMHDRGPAYRGTFQSKSKRPMV